MHYTEAQWASVLAQQVAEAREKMTIYDACSEQLRFVMRYHAPDKQCWSRRQREQEAEHAAISEAKIPGAARGHARGSARALYARDPEESRRRIREGRQARQAAHEGQTTEGETLMALMKQPAMPKIPKMKMSPAPKPLKPAMAMPKPKPFKPMKPPRLGGKR
jgi:hypothetical protein